MALVTSSVQTDLDETERLLLNKETKFGRYLKEHQNVHASTHWQQIGHAAKWLNGLAASSTELNKMEGLGASSTELNVLEGITASSKELNFLDGCASTGKLVTYQHAPWRSTVGQISSAGVASSTGMRCVIASSQLTSAGPTWTIPRTRFGLASIVAAQAQITSTRTVFATTDILSRHPCLLVPQILASNSTIVIRQYGTTNAAGTAPGSMAVSSGNCNLTVFAYGFGSS